jgi:hypothetical protein
MSAQLLCPFPGCMLLDGRHQLIAFRIFTLSVELILSVLHVCAQSGFHETLFSMEGGLVGVQLYTFLLCFINGMVLR